MDFVVEPQARIRPGIIELRWGTPDLSLLPVAEVGAATQEMLRLAGPLALDYGSNEGPEVPRAALAARIARREGRPLGLDEIAITDGISPALHQLAGLLVRPGDAVLVEDPGTASPSVSCATWVSSPSACPSTPRGSTSSGCPACSPRAGPGPVAAPARHRPDVPQPAGISLADERRRRLIEPAVAEDILLVEDDVTAASARPSGAAVAVRLAADVDGGADHVIRLGSFSKSLAPGLALRYLARDGGSGAGVHGERTDRQRGCLNEFTSLIVAALLRDGATTTSSSHDRQAYRERRDAP